MKHASFMYVHRQLVKLAIVKANVEQSNVDVEKCFFFVLPNVIHNEMLVKICMSSLNNFFCEIFCEKKHIKNLFYFLK